MASLLEDRNAAQTTVPSVHEPSDSDSVDTDCSGTAGVSYERNKKLQEQFAEEMREIATIKSHKRVAVLLLSWQKEGDDYLDLKEEVSIYPGRRTTLLTT